MDGSPRDVIHLDTDGESGHIEHLAFRSRCLHRQLAAIAEDQRTLVVLDALEIGAEVLARAGHHGDLEQLSGAVDRLDEEARKIVATTTEQVGRAVEQIVDDMTTTVQSEDGPLAAALRRFDPSADGNVIDVFRDLVTATATKATKQAVNDLAESTHETMERLTSSVAALDKVAAAEEARLAESARGTAKGVEHEHLTESLLGELVAVAGDGLDDVSTTVGLQGTKKGDKAITPRGGCTIVTEEKCSTRISESKARVLLDESMSNRGARLGMLVVDDESKVPGNQPFHFIDDDKVVVVADRLALRLVYMLFRAKAIELAKAATTSDDAAVADAVDGIRERVDSIRRTVERFRLLRTEHTKIAKAVTQSSGYVDGIEEALTTDVAEIMSVIDLLASEVDGKAAA